MQRISTAIAVVFALMLLGVCAPAQAADFDFSGTMNYHNDILLFSFTADSASTVTLFSSSWDDGGFDPMLGLWDSAGNNLFMQDDGRRTGSTQSNGVWYDHGTWDSYYDALIPGAGTYQVTLTAYLNWKNGSNLSQGFYYDGQTPIPITSWDQPANGYRSANYAFHILNVDQAVGPGPAVPEPASLSLLGFGLLGLLGLKRKK